MTTKAKLKVILKADETTVAEIEDPILWGKVLAAINAPKGEGVEAAPTAGIGESFTGNDDQAKPAGNAVTRFARSIGVTVAEVQGALDPVGEAPYLTLNKHCWEAMVKALPKRGPGSITPIGLAGTLLALWLEAEGSKTTATQALAGTVLGTINMSDKNPSRGIRNTKWLMPRSGGVIVINPAETSKAQEIAKFFCTKNWSVGAK